MILNGGRCRIRTCDFHRVNLPAFGFSATYNTAGTAKVRGSRARQWDLWVGLWVGISYGFPKYCNYGVTLRDCIHDLQPSVHPLACFLVYQVVGQTKEQL